MISKGQVFETKYDIGGKFEESLKLIPVVGHGRVWICFLLGAG